MQKTSKKLGVKKALKKSIIEGFPAASKRSSMAANNSKAEARRAEARKAEAKMEAKPVDIETQRLRLKNLIVLGKERGF